MIGDSEFIKLDSRGRVSIGKHAGGTTWFQVKVDEQGVITLVPAEVVVK